MAQLVVDVVAADRKVWSGAATLVSAPAADGEIGILAGHTPILSALRAGNIRITPDKGERVLVEITGGFLSVDHDKVTVVVDQATVLSGTNA